MLKGGDLALSFLLLALLVGLPLGTWLVSRALAPLDRTLSGVRFGTAALATRGMGRPEIREIAELIDTTLSGGADPAVLGPIRERVRALCRRFPVYG